jgi:hypothetical protein
LKPRGLGLLRRFQVDADGHGGLDPGDDAGDVVEVHVAAGAQGVEDLLQPGGAALAVGRDDHVARPRAPAGDRGADLGVDEDEGVQRLHLGHAARPARRRCVTHGQP